MNRRTRLLVIAALIALVAIGLVMALTQCGGQPVPTTGVVTTGPATAAPGTTPEPATPIATPDPSPTPTPTEGEKAAAAVGQQYIAYRPTQAECEKIVDGGETEACVWLDSTQVITRPEWKRLFPDTDFYLLDLGGYRPDSMDIYSSRRRLAAWQDGQHYTAKTFDRLLRANDVLTITEENRELVAKAFALMTIPNYLEEEVVFTEWEEGSWPSSIRLNYNYAITAWTKIQGLKIQWRFVFYEGSLIGAQGYVLDYNVGDYISIPFEKLSRPSQDSLRYWRR